MLKYGNKEFRNLEEQVCKNKSDIEFILEEEGVLNQFGIKVIGELEPVSSLPESGEEGEVVALRSGTEGSYTYKIYVYTGEEWSEDIDDYKEIFDDWAYGDAYAIGTESPYSLRVLTRANGTHANDYWFNIGTFPLAGPTGPQGPQGPQGETGDQGPTGPEALTFSESISIATIDIDVNVTLPLTNFNHTPEIGNTVLIPLREIATSLYALGIVEITAVGDVNATGVINEYMPLPKGQKGDQGEAGPKGDTGADVLVVKPILNMTSAVMGTTITLNNVSANFSRTPVVGDSALAVFYVPNATPVYTYIGKFEVTTVSSGQSTLTLKDSRSILGPQGQQGPQGPQGNTGPTGSTGPIALAYSPVIYQGSTEPSAYLNYVYFSSFNRDPSTLYDYNAKVLMYWLDTTTGKYYHAVYTIVNINPGQENVQMSLFSSVEINFEMTGSSDYDDLLNKPIINVDITGESFTPVEGTYYRNTNGAAYVATDFVMGQSYDTLYFPTNLSTDDVEALLEPIIANQSLLSGNNYRSLQILLDNQDQKYLSWHDTEGNYTDIWTKADGWNTLFISTLNSALALSPLTVSTVNTYDLVSSAPISYFKKHIYLYENNEFKDISGGGSGAVSSVNGQTGVVVLTASNINATNSQSVQANLERIDTEVEGVIDDLADKQAAITSIELNGATTNTVTYDSTEGINIVGTGEINGTDTISTEFNIPIIPGTGISIDATVSDDAVEIKIDPTTLASKQDVITSSNKLDYSLISNTPTIPSKTSDLTNDSGFITSADIPSIPTKTSDLTNDSGFITSSYHDSTKQDALVSGTNIKTVNNYSLLGSGNVNLIASDITTTGTSTVQSNLDYLGINKADNNAVVHLSGNETVGGTKTFTSSPNVNGLRSTGSLHLINSSNEEVLSVAADSNGGMEFGPSGTATARTPFIDFHTGNTNNDYDVRLLAGNGVVGTPGKGTLDITANQVNLNGAPLLTAASVANKVNTITLTQAEFDALTQYADNTNYQII